MTATIERTGLACPPRFGTPRDFSRQTLGPAVGRVARMLGKPLMEWQQYVADVSLEIDAATQQLAYDEVILGVPRQSGKTTLKLAKATHRCSASDFFGRRQHVVYTAQTRKDARKKFIEEFAPDLEGSAFSSRIHPHWGNGNEHIRFTNGSWFGIEATTEKAGHGGVLDEAYIDEAFAHQDGRLEQAFSPAMITRPNKQLWVVSTAGWLDASPFLLEKVLVGRDHVTSGAPGKLAYFEWSADEDDDPEDEGVWWRCMPALGHTISIEAIRSELDKAQRAGNLNGFRRAYLNQWVHKDAAAESAISPEAWADLEEPNEDQRPTPVALSVVVSEDRKWSSIGLAGRRSDGRAHLQIIHAQRGTGGLAAKLAELNGKWKPTGVAIHPGSPAGSLLSDLEKQRLPVVKVGSTELGQACGLFSDTVDEKQAVHTGQPQVAVAIGATDKRKSGESFIWKAREGTDISPLWALTLALHVLAKSEKAPRTGGPRRVVVLT